MISGGRRWRKAARLITLDFDPTCGLQHCGNLLSLFNAFRDTYCYLPVPGCLSFDREQEQDLVAALLRSPCVGQGRPEEATEVVAAADSRDIVKSPAVDQAGHGFSRGGVAGLLRARTAGDDHPMQERVAQVWLAPVR